MTAPSSGNLFKSPFECGGVGEVTGLDSPSVVPSLVPSQNSLLSSGWKVMSADAWRLGVPCLPCGSDTCHPALRPYPGRKGSSGHAVG